jgi:hypothetical protein
MDAYTMNLLIKSKIVDFIFFMGQKDYIFRLEKEHSKLTTEELEKYLKEYLEGIDQH